MARDGGAERLLPYALFAAVAIGYGALCLTGTMVPGTPVYTAITGAIFVSLDVACAAWAVRAATRPVLDRPERRAWWLLAGGMLTAAVAGNVYGATIDSTGVVVAEPRLLLVYTTARAVALVLLLAGLLLLAAQPLLRSERVKLALDSLTVLGGSAMIIWYLLAGPALTERGHGSAVRAVAVAWPLLDLAMLVGLCTVLIRGVRPAVRTPVGLLVAACLVSLLTNLQNAHVILRHPDTSANLAFVIGGMVMLMLFAAAGRERCRAAALEGGEPLPEAVRSVRPHPSLPYLALGVGFAVLVVAASRSALYPWAGLVLGAVLMTATTAARQAIVVAENRELSHTDGLTGLSNRLPLWGSIERATARSRRSGTPLAVLLLDLDGFKRVNDEYGHEAGDAMLVAFADILLGSVRATDLVARLGGDEFAVVLEDVTGRRATTVAERVLERASVPVPLGRRGPLGGLPIRCSIGIAVGDPLEPGGVPEPQELLHRADLAMYASKQAGSHAWRVHEEDRPGEPDEDRAPRRPTSAT